MNAVKTYNIRELKAVASYFKGNKRFGRTTTLIHVPTGTVVYEGMGIATRQDLYNSYLYQQSMQNRASK